jgi:hypothetical protein
MLLKYADNGKIYHASLGVLLQFFDFDVTIPNPVSVILKSNMTSWIFSEACPVLEF